jgi:hypothetical protein
LNPPVPWCSNDTKCRPRQSQATGDEEHSADYHPSNVPGWSGTRPERCAEEARRRSGKACAREWALRREGALADSPGRWTSALRVLGSIVAIPRPMRPCARPGFDGRAELRPVGGGDAEPDRGAGGAEGLARREDHRDHGVLALLTELIFEGFGHIAHRTSSVRPTSSAPRRRRIA